jgi:hypothetical protein
MASPVANELNNQPQKTITVCYSSLGFGRRFNNPAPVFRNFYERKPSISAEDNINMDIRGGNFWGWACSYDRPVSRCDSVEYIPRIVCAHFSL